MSQLGLSSPWIRLVDPNNWIKTELKTKDIFAGATGFIQSYNYAGGLHLANQDYSACIRTERGYCSISYTQVWKNSHENAFLLTDPIWRNTIRIQFYRYLRLTFVWAVQERILPQFLFLFRSTKSFLKIPKYMVGQYLQKNFWDTALWLTQLRYYSNSICRYLQLTLV